jgi:arylsulfatase A-like enzyme
MIRFLALLLSALVGCTPEPPRLSVPDEEPPDTVILVVGCTLRADRTNVHGGPRNTTPYLQRLAEGGAHFTRVIANSGWTRPTIGAITTGAHPVSMGLDHGGHRAIDPAFTTLGERFTDAGWTTVGITANPNANPVFGFDQGFAQYQGTEALFRDGLAIRPGTDVVDDFAAMIEDVEGPLFGQVVFLDAHAPWAKNYGTQLLQGHVPSKRRRDLYDAALVDLDEAIAALDARLAELGRSNRLIMVIGDHGQGLRTPRWAGTGHGTVLYDAHTHVPWVVHGPGVAPGHELGGLAQQLDVVPTLMSMAGLRAEDGLEGVDHSAAIAGAADSTPPARILSASRVRNADEIRLTTDDWTVFRARGKFKRRRNVPHELFATSDTTQADDVAADEPDLLRQLLLEAQVRWKRLDDAAIVVKVDVDTDQQDLLKELGYLDGDEEE